MTLAYGAPFSTPLLALLDLLRLATVVGGLLIVGAMAAEWNRGVVRPGRRARHLGVTLIVLTLAGSRVQNLGEAATWQLLTGALGIIALCWVVFRRTRTGEAV